MSVFISSTLVGIFNFYFVISPWITDLFLFFQRIITIHCLLHFPLSLSLLNIHFLKWRGEALPNILQNCNLTVTSVMFILQNPNASFFPLSTTIKWYLQTSISGFLKYISVFLSRRYSPSVLLLPQVTLDRIVTLDFRSQQCALCSALG